MSRNTLLAALCGHSRSGSGVVGPGLDRVAVALGQDGQRQDRARHGMPDRDVDMGHATITFRLGADGRPTDIISASARPGLARAAKQTALRLRNLPALPAGVSPDTRITMRLLFGRQSEMVRFYADQAKLLRDADTANVQYAARIGGTQLASNAAVR